MNFLSQLLIIHMCPKKINFVASKKINKDKYGNSINNRRRP